MILEPLIVCLRLQRLERGASATNTDYHYQCYAPGKKPHLPASPVPMEWLNLEGIGDKKKKKKKIK
jgi:hypothetical protein